MSEFQIGVLLGAMAAFPVGLAAGIAGLIIGLGWNDKAARGEL